MKKKKTESVPQSLLVAWQRHSDDKAPGSCLEPCRRRLQQLARDTPPPPPPPHHPTVCGLFVQQVCLYLVFFLSWFFYLGFLLLSQLNESF